MALAVASAVLAALPGIAGAAYAQSGAVDPGLRRLVEAELRRDLEDARAMNGQAAHLHLQAVDLNGDGQVDVIALMDHPFSCGAGGCAVHVFVGDSGRLRRVGDILASDVEPSTTTTQGWRDLAVNGRRWTLQNGRYQPGH